MRVKTLTYYPIKSCAGISVDKAELLLTGLAFDRQWMLIDAEGNFITQRALAAMCLIQTQVEIAEEAGKVILHVSAPGMPRLSVPRVLAGEPISVAVWKDRCQAFDQREQSSEWFSTFLGTHCRLVAFDPSFKRHVDPDYARTADDIVGFADGYPILLISSASLEDLNGRLLDDELPMNRFRPNIEVEGSAAFDEDTWQSIRISTVEFDVVKSCSRCQIVTIDQDTAKSSREPLATLATYRRINNKIMFGQNLIPRNAGRLSVGDNVEVIKALEQ